MRIAAIDIGSNSIHIIVVHVRPDLSFEVIDREKEMVRLGAGSLDGRPLTDAAITAAIGTLTRFKRLAEAHQVDEILATATSAVREAPNGGEFLARVADRTGLQPRVIPGVEEARLVHRAAVYAVDATRGNTVVVDIGGGTTEVTLGNTTEVHLARSFKLGAIRLTERFVRSDPLTAGDERRLVRHVTAQIEDTVRQIATAGFDRVVGTSGTILAVGAVALSGGRIVDAERIHHARTTAKQLHRARKAIVEHDIQGRARLPGLDSRRADQIVAGAVLLDTIVNRLGATEITLCDVGLREGLVLDFIHRNRREIARIENYPDIRRRSVIELAERCQYYPEHADQVARLALSLFDQTRGVHGLGDRAREWLDYAAILHDIGGHISYRRHHRHSYYLIRNGGLRGFEPDEVLAIALIARYHRRGRPRNSQEGLGSLPGSWRRTIGILSALLCLAESLDRSHSQLIDRIELQDRGATYRLQLHPRGDVELELWAARRQIAPFEKMLGNDVRIEAEMVPSLADVERPTAIGKTLRRLEVVRHGDPSHRPRPIGHDQIPRRACVAPHPAPSSRSQTPLAFPAETRNSRCRQTTVIGASYAGIRRRHGGPSP